MLVCALVSMVMVVGVAEAKKGSGKAVKGKFVSYKQGTLTIATKGGEKQFKVSPGTPVHVWTTGSAKPDKTSAPKGLEGVPMGTRIHVHVNGAAVVSVGVSPPQKKKKQ
jgi:hypothetical protein